MAAVPDSREKIAGKGNPNRYDQSSIAMRSSVERVSNLRQRVH